MDGHQVTTQPRPAPTTGPSVRDRALAAVVTNLAPVPFLVVPFTFLVSRVLADHVDAVRVRVWLSLAAAVTVVSAVAVHRGRALRRGAPSSRSGTLWLAAALSGLGAVFGLSPWVAATSSFEVVLLFTLFPATASAVGCIVTAGRRDLFLAFLTPLTVASAASLATSGDDRLRGLSLLSGFFAVALVALHHVLGRGTLDGIRLQWRTQELLGELDHERAELRAVNERLAATNSRLAHQATHDPLTGLPNRRGMLDLLEQHLVDAVPDRPVALLFCDLDRFKAVNDALGHRGGDRFLSIIADRLVRSVEAGTVAGRMGGDEFVVVMPDHDLPAATAIARRLVAALAQPIHAEGRDVPSSVSIGLAVAPAHGSGASELLRNANAALYRAKAGGRNRVECFDDDMRREVVTRLEGEQALRRAIDDGEIVAFYQPEIDATTGRLVGAELLARWVRRDGRVVPAGDFLGLASSAGLLERITERVIADARPQVRRLALLGLPEGFRVRVNLAPEATERRWRDDPIDSLLHGLDPSLVTIDVREAAVAADVPAASATLASFRARGGRVCLDDFARGVSSLSLLRRLPLDEVRVDRGSIDTLAAHPHDWAIARSIIALVRELGLEVTADGVQTGAQADALVALGCVRHQGHLYAPAVPAATFEDLLLTSMADQYLGRASVERTWRTDELA